MPMQSKTKQQLMDEKTNPMHRKESEAAKMLSLNEARSKRYYERIEAQRRGVARRPRVRPVSRSVHVGCPYRD